MLFLLTVYLVAAVGLLKVWRTAPPFGLSRQAGNSSYLSLLRRSGTSLIQWIGCLLLGWGIFASERVNNHFLGPARPTPALGNRGYVPSKGSRRHANGDTDDPCFCFSWHDGTYWRESNASLVGYRKYAPNRSLTATTGAPTKSGLGAAPLSHRTPGAYTAAASQTYSSFTK